jgi:hypothetical protein
MKNVYGYHLPNGDLLIYGDNLETCIPYIDNVVDSVEDICEYCSQHNLRILHKTHFSIRGLIEYIRVSRLTKKYSVRGTWKEMNEFAK